MVGVNTAIFSPSGGSVGIGFAIPAGTVDNVVDSLEHGGVVNRGYLGVQIQPVSQDIADGARPEDRERRAGRRGHAGNPGGRRRV